MKVDRDVYCSQLSFYKQFGAAVCCGGEFLIDSNSMWTVGGNVAAFSISWLQSPRLCSRKKP